MDLIQIVINKLNDRYWRLNHLYSIIDKSGDKIPFKLNWAQKNVTVPISDYCLVHYSASILFNGHTAMEEQYIMCFKINGGWYFGDVKDQG